jgi:cbb3-type cytochrome oxidase subunit 3
MVGLVTLLVGEMTFVLSGFFAAVWLLSAWLFRKAARQASE